MFMETSGFAQSNFSHFQTHRRRMSFQILHQDEAVPSNLLWHTFGKLQNLKLVGNASMKIAEVPGWLESLMIHFSF